MLNPAFDKGPLAPTRSEASSAGRAPRDTSAWHSGNERPPKASYYMVREHDGPRELTRRVLFSGHFWMSETPVGAWREPTEPEATQAATRSISQLASKLIDDRKSAPGQYAKSFEELALVPIDGPGSDELNVLGRLAELALRVEVVRFLRPASGAQGVTSGKVLSVSENYSAQHAGADRVVVHENKNLPRALTPGESVTLEYRGGKVYAYDGIAHDINIVAPWMPQEQQAYLRRVMFDALSSMTAPQSDDERLRDAMRYALESTARYFGPNETMLRKADIRLVVNELEAVVKPPEPPAGASGTPPAAAAAPVPVPVRRMRMR